MTGENDLIKGCMRSCIAMHSYLRRAAYNTLNFGSGAAGQRAAMSREMQQLQQLAAQEESRLQGARVDLDLAKSAGYQQQLADLRASEAASRLQGVQGIAQTSGDLFKAFTPLYNPNEQDS